MSHSSTYHTVMLSSTSCFTKSDSLVYTDVQSCNWSMYIQLYLELLEMVYAMELFYAMSLDSCVTYNLYATDVKDMCLLHKHQ